MGRFVLCLFILLQAVYFTGAVCGSNLSTANSMACCKNGRMDHMNMQASKTHSCCAHCDLGKNKSTQKPQKGIQKDIRQMVQMSVGTREEIDWTSISGSMVYQNKWSHREAFTAFSPPFFVLHEQFLI